MTTSRTEPAPLLVTAHLDGASFAVLDGLRRRHFPPALNRVPAHISLFHRLPGSEAAAVVAAVSALCREIAPLQLVPAHASFLGRGVALAYTSTELGRLREGLAAQWRSWLTPQDRQPFKAHVTIQNKVTPHEARALFDTLRGELPPPCGVDGITIWRYLGGPWERVQTCFFALT